MTNSLKVLTFTAGLACAAATLANPSHAAELSLLCPPPVLSNQLSDLPPSQYPPIPRLGCIYDTHLQPIGIPESGGYLIRPEGPKPFRIYYDSRGLGGVYFYWITPNCGAGQPAGSAGAQPYFYVGSVQANGPTVTLLQEAAYDGKYIWAPEGTAAALQVASAGQGPGPTCGATALNPANYPTYVVQPAYPVEALTIYPPLSPLVPE